MYKIIINKINIINNTDCNLTYFQRDNGPHRMGPKTSDHFGPPYLGSATLAFNFA